PSLDPPVKAYRADLAAHGLPPRTVSVDRSLKGGRVGAQTVLRRWPDTDAIVAVTDAIALGALAALANAGARIPDDVAVIGFDDVPLAELARPSLTTVTHPVEQIAAGAVRALCAGKVDIDESVVHPVTLCRGRAPDRTPARGARGRGLRWKRFQVVRSAHGHQYAGRRPSTRRRVAVGPARRRRLP